MIDPTDPLCSKCRHWPARAPSAWCVPCREAAKKAQEGVRNPDLMPANGRLVADDTRAPDIHLTMEVRDGASLMGALVIRTSSGHANGRLVPEGLSLFTREDLLFVQEWER